MASCPAIARQAGSAPAAARTTSYDAAFFAQYAPRTAYDIVQHVPGFQLDLGSTQSATGSVDVRGFAATAGNVVFTGGNTNTLVALNATTGDALWQARLNTTISNGPITYTLDGQQYVVVGAGDTLWAFVLNPPPARR